MPTGVRMPVESMSIRALIGIVQAFTNPGRVRASSISAINSSQVMGLFSGHAFPNKCFNPSGAQLEYHLLSVTVRHSL